QEHQIARPDNPHRRGIRHGVRLLGFRVYGFEPDALLRLGHHGHHGPPIGKTNSRHLGLKSALTQPLHTAPRVLLAARETLTCARRENRMPATILDSAVFRDIFTTEAMRTVFSDENRVQKYLDFEAALARAQAKLGIIPKEAATEIVRHCSVDK